MDEGVSVELPADGAECRRLAREEGLRVGQSAGASDLAAKRGAADLRDMGAYAGAEPLVITVFWDSGERYLSSGTFDE